ncbi:uncharacterized protein BN771_01198 [Clostridium sp. CAG:75]|nr:uncharacterized protein BN771_01198 [Clostridium sp. CAG:75]
MSLRTDDLQTTKFRNPIAKLNIGTTTGHIRCDRNGTLLSGIRNNLCLQLMELRIQDFMRNACFLKFSTQILRSINCDRTDQNRLPLLVSLYNVSNNGIELVLFGLIYCIIIVNTRNRLVGRDFNNVHLVNLTELFFLSQRSTGHTGFLLVFIKEVLERDRCQCFTLSLDLNMLFRLDRLVQTIRKTASRHDTSRKLINDQNLIVFYHIIFVAMHQRMCTKR